LLPWRKDRSRENKNNLGRDETQRVFRAYPILEDGAINVPIDVAHVRMARGMVRQRMQIVSLQRTVSPGQKGATHLKRNELKNRK
jgi:hypothetical protein